MKLGWLDWTALILVIIGGLNWGLYIFGWNLVDGVFGQGLFLANLIYVLVALSALYTIVIVRKLSKLQTA